MYQGKYSQKAVDKRMKSLAEAGQGKMAKASRPSTRGKLGWIRIALFLVCLAITVSGLWQLVSYLTDISQNRSSTEHLTQLAVQTIPPRTAPSAPPAADGVPGDTPEEELPEPTEPKEYAPILVDFTLLQQENPDIIGWIYCPDTPINYPVMRSQNNQDYIRMLPDRRVNAAGSLFLDYRLQTDFLNGYTVIYGHNMRNDTMFGSLEEYKNQEYYDAHPVVYLITPDAAYRVDLFAGFVTGGRSEFYSIPVEGPTAQQLMDKALSMSTFHPAAQPGDGPWLLLSTCSYEYGDARYIVAGTMTQIEKE